MRKILNPIFLLCFLLLTACGDGYHPSPESMVSPTPIPDGHNHVPPTLRYGGQDYYFSHLIKDVDFESLELLGKTNFVERSPVEDFDNTFMDCGGELYRKNEHTLIARDISRGFIYLAYDEDTDDSKSEAAERVRDKYWTKLLSPEKIANERMPEPCFVMYNDRYYIFDDPIYYIFFGAPIRNLNIEDYKFIGKIDCRFSEYATPTENLSSNFFKIGTGIYYNDEHSIIMYDEDKEIAYIGYDEETTYPEESPEHLQDE